MKEAKAFDAFLQRRFNWSAVAPEILEDSEWGPTVVSGDQSATGDVHVGQNAAGKTVEKVGGDADHEARVAAAFGGLELGETEQLATAARQSRLRRMEGLESEQTDGADSEERIVASLDERSAAASTLSTATAGSASSPQVGFQDAYLQMGGHVDDIPTSPSAGGSLPPPGELNTSWESPTAAEFRIRSASLFDLIVHLPDLHVLFQLSLLCSHACMFALLLFLRTRRQEKILQRPRQNALRQTKLLPRRQQRATSKPISGPRPRQVLKASLTLTRMIQATRADAGRTGSSIISAWILLTRAHC